MTEEGLKNISDDVDNRMCIDTDISTYCVNNVDKAIEDIKIGLDYGRNIADFCMVIDILDGIVNNSVTSSNS